MNPSWTPSTIVLDHLNAPPSPKGGTHQPTPPLTQPGINPSTLKREHPSTHPPLTQSCINPGTVPKPSTIVLDYTKLSPTPRWTSTNHPTPTQPYINHGTVSDSLNNLPGLSQPHSQPMRDIHQPNQLRPTRQKSRYRPGHHQQSSWTISTPLPVQRGHRPTPKTPYPTPFKSQYRPGPPQQSSWTIPTPLPAQRGHPSTHTTPDPTRYKSWYRPGSSQLSSWTILTPSQPNGDIQQSIPPIIHPGVKSGTVPDPTQQSSWTIPNPLPSQGGHLSTHPTHYPTQSMTSIRVGDRDSTGIHTGYGSGWVG